MNFQPMRDLIVVEPIERVKSDLIEVVMNEKDCIGIVRAAGPGKIDAKGRRFMPVKVGDRIRFGTTGKDEYLKYQNYHENDVRYLVMSWQDVNFIEET
jgi:co-chaperonin GroES (HSP10)